MRAAIMIFDFYFYKFSRAEQPEILVYTTRERHCTTGMHHPRHSNLLTRLLKNADVLAPFQMKMLLRS